MTGARPFSLTVNVEAPGFPFALVGERISS
jgi:hypothetical protein